MENKKTKIAIIGAGISGLSVAYWLHRKGFDVTIFEKEPRFGGSIVTEKHDGFLIDLGPNSTLETSQILTDLISELGLNDQKIYSNKNSNKRYIVKNSTLHPLPMNPPAFIKSGLFSLKAKLRLIIEPFLAPTKREDISLSDFVKYRLGQEFLDYAINPFVAGVYAGDPDSLSVSAAFPKLYALEQKYGSLIKGAVKGARERKNKTETAKNKARLFSFLNGMSTLTESLANLIGDKIKLNHNVSEVKFDGQFLITVNNKDKHQNLKYDKIILTVPAFTLPNILGHLTKEITSLEKIEYPPVAVVYMGFRKEDVQKKLDGFGFLIPKIENRKILGSIWNSSIFPNRAPDGFTAITTFIGGTRQPELVQHNDNELEKIVYNDLNDLIGLNGKPEYLRIKRWAKAIPQYNLGYQKYQDLIKEVENKFPGLYFSGNYIRGISIGDSVLCSHETVQKILTEN